MLISDESDEEQEAFDVKNLMNKFKNIENMGAKQMERKLDELEALRVEAKNLRQKFEQSGGDTEEHSEEKKRQLEEEFKQLKGNAKTSLTNISKIPKNAIFKRLDSKHHFY